MQLDESSELNLNVIRYLKKGERSHLSIASPNSVPDPYYKQGSHPDIVERIWDQINPSLPNDSRCLVYGSPALVHPKSGIIFAFAGGTVYYLRLSVKVMDEAMKAGAKTRIKWTTEGEMDTKQEFGTDWILGGWLSDEIRWCNVLYNELNTKAI